MPVDYIIALVILANISLFSLFLYGVYYRKLKFSQGYSILAALLTSPFLLSLILYLLFTLFPGQSPFFYILITFLLPVLLILIYPNKLDEFKIKPIKISYFTKLISILFLFIFGVCTLRIFFWPINWDDQIYYIEQAYAIGQERSMQTYNNWGIFDNGILRFNTNPSIRPGLPLLYSLSVLFSNRLSTVVVFSQFMTFYFLVYFTALIFYISKRISKINWFENGLIANLLVFSTYQFISYSVQGFKELPILCLILLSLDLFNKFNNELSNGKLFFIGCLLGLASYINLSGSLLAIVVLIIYYLFSQIKILHKVKNIFYITLFLVILSGAEFIYLFNWTLSGGRKVNNIDQIVQIYTTKTPESSEITTEVPYRVSEYKSYDIESFWEKYTKGKLQGFFQYSYYGLVFPLFILVLVFKYKDVISNRYSMMLLTFVGLYYLILVDFLNLNPSSYAYVTTVSHKYTVMITPIITLIISPQWQAIKKIFNLVSLKSILILSFIFPIFSIVVLKPNQSIVFSIISRIIPVLNSKDYYLNIIGMGINTLNMIFVLIFLTSIILLLIYKTNCLTFWKKNCISSFIVIFLLYFSPVLFFFHTNYGLDSTLLNSFSSTDTKLSLIKGWNNLYLMINQLNRLPPDSKVGLFQQPYLLMAIHLSIPAEQIYFGNNYDKYSYLVINNKDKCDLASRKLIYSNEERSLYSPELAN